MPTKSTKTKPVVEEPVIEPEQIETPAIQEETVTFKRSHFYSILTILAFATGILLGYVVWGFDTAAAQVSETGAQAQGPVVEAPVTQEPQFTRYDVPSEGFPSIGPADAPITIVEFSDYQCPFCRDIGHRESHGSHEPAARGATPVVDWV